MADGNDSNVCPQSTWILTSGDLYNNEFDVELLSQYLFPVLIMQTLVILLVTRFLDYLLKPYSQPRIVAELLGGILLGPTFLGKLTYQSSSATKQLAEMGGGSIQKAESLGVLVAKPLSRFVFPTTSFGLMHAIGFLGLIYHVFLIAVELDVKVFKVMGKKVLAVAAGCLALPLLVSVAATTVFGLPAPMANNSYKATSGTEQTAFVLLLSFALSITAFPVLARLLRELKIVNPHVGLVVLPSALIGDVIAWILLAVCFAIIGRGDAAAPQFKDERLAPLWTLLAGALLVLGCMYVARPLLAWIARQTPEGEPVNNTYMGLVAVFVLAAALASATVGFHPVFGVVVLGLAVPKGSLTTTLIERLDDYVTGFMLPFLIVSSGLKANVWSILSSEGNEPPYYGLRLVCIVVLASFIKVTAGVIISSFFSMPRCQGTSLGILMNTIGPAQLIILNMGKHDKVFNQKIYTVLLVASVVSTAIVSPMVKAISNNSRGLVTYEQRNLQLSGQDSELRMVACVHTVRSVPSIISLLQLSNPTRRSPLVIYALHLVELTNRTPPMLIVHEAGANNGSVMSRSESGNNVSDFVHSEPIVSAFEKYQQQADSVTVQSLTSVAPYSSMHEDICHIAEDHRATLIILPFHKLLTVDGEMEDINPAVRTVNEGVASYAPCSVAILVDRCLGEIGKLDHHMSIHVAILFIGGPDDREALMYGCRFAEQPGVDLTVVRFLSCRDAEAPGKGMFSVKAEQRVDNEFIREFRARFMSNTSVMYKEKVVSNCAETVAAIREMNSGTFNFFVVGKASGVDSALVAGLMSDFTEYPELGPIGDVLVSADFGAMVSVLVVQHYAGERRGWGNETGSHRRLGRARDGYSAI